MGNAVVGAAVMDGLRASVASLDALFLRDAQVDCAQDPDAEGEASVVDVLERKSELRLQRLAFWKQLAAQAAAGMAADATDFAEFQEAMTPPDATGAERAFVEMSTTAEVAGVLTLSPGAAAAFISQSRKVCAMPAVAGALASGLMSWRHAVIVADEADCLATESAEALVAHFFDPDAPNRARGLAPGDLVAHLFRRKVRTWRERTYPASLAARHARCVADRRMEYRPDADGMASITLILPGDTACAIWNKTTAIARGLRGPGETRTLTQLRPDTAAALLLSAHTGAAATGGLDGGEGSGSASGADSLPGASGNGTDPYFVDLSKIPAPKADVLVTIPIFTMLGSTEEPADLDGYGPISAAMARKLVADGATSFYRVLVDPRDGAPLEIGRTSYRLTMAMKRWIRMRDGHCTFPGCTNPSTDNDTDHLTAWQHHGTTGVSNLAQLCPKHHRLKHNSGWTPTPATGTEPPGWTSPTGRHYPAQHPDPQQPHWPPGLPDALHMTGSLEQRILAGVAVCPEYLLADPPDDELLDEEFAWGDRVASDNLSPDDPLWEVFYAAPFELPTDPQQEHRLHDLSLT
ncbi:HNH endonuclease [Pseudarthrobacter sp. SL88]|uniref:HNH endonuclease signature motif containing protein n=1 Tax=Pseudarthrobacter sp. SL88 TaxID=2994666 RepID=UPI002273C2B1|nr:HNH endonuclease [Pseudarthrobacter sp. SL88]MCY1675934.1 HNH endonuclease [Pseudarthrobacter sp. SL88]